MKLKKAIKILENIKWKLYLNDQNDFELSLDLEEQDAIDTILEEIKNSINKNRIKEEINRLGFCIELQKTLNIEKNDDEDPEKYYFAKKILKELLEE